MPLSNHPADVKRRSLPLFGKPDMPRHLVPTRAEPGPPPRSARVSVTDRCDVACTYCRPARRDGDADGRLRPGAWKTRFDALRAAGVHRVRLAGGEPLIHPGVVSFVSFLSSLGFEDLALTTNASQLVRLAKPLR